MKRPSDNDYRTKSADAGGGCDATCSARVSAGAAGITTMQHEPGVADAPSTGARFGPANRTDYEQADWAMVPVGPAQTRLETAPAPSLRKRAVGAPAFLVQGISKADGHRLGGLLTILHEIPLARNVLLSTGSPAASYGHNSEWWKGQEILPPHVLARMQQRELGWESRTRQPAFEEEIHRLMAFLDSTERSYGTVSVLTDLIPYYNLGAEKQFYELLSVRNEEKIQPLYQVAALAHVLGDGTGDDEAKFGMLEMEHLKQDYANIKTLYESLDHIMWSDVLSWNELHDESKMALFKEMGEILVVKIGGEGPEEPLEIPLELYPEKYLQERERTRPEDTG